VKTTRDLTLAFMVFMLIIPSLVLFASNPKIADFDTSKNYIESYVHHDAIWIQSNQEFIDQAAAESWAGDGSEETPFIITGYSFNQETQPLRIWNTDVHWRFINNIVDGIGDDIQCGTWIDTVSNGAIIDCEFLNRHSGMVITNVENFTVSGNYVHATALDGIDIQGMTTNCNITDNIVEDINHHGILVGGMSSGILSRNEVSDCRGRGISIASGFHHSELKSNIISGVEQEAISVQLATYSEISFNSISYAEGVGLALIGFNTCVLRNNTISSIPGKGVSVDYCQFSDIIMNDIENCTEIGIQSLGGSNTTIRENTICDCDGYAISLNEDTEFFDIRFNVFMDNGGGCQLYDDGENNIFNFNYFSDWLSPDDNNDNFVDLPYEVDGTADNSDDWPLTVIGCNPSSTTSTGTSSATTAANIIPNPTTTLVIVGGAIGVIVLIAGVLVLKRR